MLRALALIWVIVLCAIARAQDEVELVTVELRITNAQPGLVVVDRGSADGLAENDRVRFLPRGGSAFEGRVKQLGERSARVELEDPTLKPEAGTRGEARLPSSRFAAPAAQPQPELAQPPERAAGEPERPWKDRDEGYRKGQPLLARVRPLHPEERPARMTGRAYLIADYITSGEDDRSSQFYRAGTSLTYDNVLGRGETIQFDGELNWRDVDVPDNDDETKSRFRLDRLAYSVGGTRFEPSRLQFGRFLQSGMVEFGVLDGLEWTTRTDSGSRLGASVGFMPEPDPEYETGSDAQAAAFYRWSYDESEQFTAAAGYQKTLHNGDADRDLFVLDLRLLPTDDWNLNATAWIDFYTSGDEFKDAGFEATQVLARLGRRWDGGPALDFVYLHSAYPEMERHEYVPVLGTQLARDHLDRLAVEARTPLSRTVRVQGRLGGWVDEDDDGADAELGGDIQDVLIDGLWVDLRGFASWGRFSSVVGARGALGLNDSHGAWLLECELTNQRIEGFTADNDDLPQNTLRLSRTHDTDTGWSFSAHVEAVLWDEEIAVAAGLYLQKSF